MKISPRWLLAASLLIATPAVGQEAPEEEAAEQATDDVKQRVEVLLSGIEDVPSEEDWARLGDAAVPALVEIARDRKAKVVKRGRAAIGLGNFDTDSSKQALRMLLVDSSTPTLLLRKSMIALARLEGPAAVQPVAKHLDHKSKRVREQAIKTLGGLQTGPARAALGARSQVEKSRHLKEMIETELQKPMKTQVATPAVDTTTASSSTEEAAQ